MAGSLSITLSQIICYRVSEWKQRKSVNVLRRYSREVRISSTHSARDWATISLYSTLCVRQRVARVHLRQPIHVWPQCSVCIMQARGGSVGPGWRRGHIVDDQVGHNIYAIRTRPQDRHQKVRTPSPPSYTWLYGFMDTARIVVFI